MNSPSSHYIYFLVIPFLVNSACMKFNFLFVIITLKHSFLYSLLTHFLLISYSNYSMSKSLLGYIPNNNKLSLLKYISLLITRSNTFSGRHWRARVGCSKRVRRRERREKNWSRCLQTKIWKYGRESSMIKKKVIEESWKTNCSLEFYPE